jgi:hypothetical protein
MLVHSLAPLLCLMMQPSTTSSFQVSPWLQGTIGVSHSVWAEFLVLYGGREAPDMNKMFQDVDEGVTYVLFLIL